MRIIKLSTITSTNDFFKDKKASESLGNYTVAWSLQQTQGKGQRGTDWAAEQGKSLTFSMLVKEFALPLDELFKYNMVVALAVYKALKNLQIPDLAIKWPNDILSANRKIGGILIENAIKSASIDSVIGIGINVNQSNFTDLPQAGSLYLATKREWDMEEVLVAVASEVKFALENWELTRVNCWEEYYQALYKYQQWMPFVTADGNRFQGKIIGVSPQGRLQVQDQNDAVNDYEIKEIKMEY